MSPAVATSEYIAPAADAPKAPLQRLYCLAAVSAVLLHVVVLILGFWLGGKMTATQVCEVPPFISVNLECGSSGGKEAGRQEPGSAPGRKSVLPERCSAGRNSVSPAPRVEKERSAEKPVHEISRESKEVAGEENSLAKPASDGAMPKAGGGEPAAGGAEPEAGGGGSLSSQAAPGSGSGTGQGVGPGVPAEVLARPLYEVNPPPLYPRLARRMGKQGVVLLEVVVSAWGTVTDVKVASGSGSELLDAAALDAVRGWRFSPGLRNGRSVAMRVRVPVRFELRE